MTSVVVSILNWNSAEATINCLRSLSELYLPEISIQRIVVDNCSKDNSVDILNSNSEFFERLIIAEDNLGYASGHQLAYESVKNDDFDFFWILNNDLVCDRTTLKELVERFDHQSPSILGSLSVYNRKGSPIEYYGLEVNKEPDYEIFQNLNPYFNYPYEEIKNKLKTAYVDHLHGSSLLISKNIIEQYGFISTDYFMYCEEHDYCYRLWKNGVKSKIVVESVVFHDGQQSTSANYYLEGIRKYYLKRNSLILSNRYSAHKPMKRKGISLLHLYFKMYKVKLKKLLTNDNNLKRLLWIQYCEFKAEIHFSNEKTGKTLDPQNFINK